MENHGLFFEFSEDIFFLFLSYFLCRYNISDTEGIPFTVDYKKISNDFGISPSYARKIVQYYQKVLSQLSCEFILKIINETEELQLLKNVLPFLCMSSDEGRKVLPCYAVTEVILKHAISAKLNIIIWVKSAGNDKENFILGFRGSLRQELEPIDLDLCHNNEPCLVFYGTSQNLASLGKQDFLIGINTIGVQSLIRCNNAFHPQYSGRTLQAFSYNPYLALLNEKGSELAEELASNLYSLSNELEMMKGLAKFLGCTISDQRSFLLKHIFCDTIRRYKTKNTLYAGPLAESSMDGEQTLAA